MQHCPALPDDDRAPRGLRIPSATNSPIGLTHARSLQRALTPEFSADARLVLAACRHQLVKAVSRAGLG